MGKTLAEIAQQLKNAEHRTSPVTEKISAVKVQLIYAFNGMGKTRLSREFKQLIAPRADSEEAVEVEAAVEAQAAVEAVETAEETVEETPLARRRILYYNAFTEDLFYWDNDLERDTEPKLKIQPNDFTKWVFQDQGQDQNIITHFQRYTDEKLTPRFSADFSEVTFSFERGNKEPSENIKISKGEESNFIWSIFYSLLVQVIAVLNVAEPVERETDQFNQLEYVFIDDPVSSLDENHLIELAVDLAKLVKSSLSELKFIITTHNPLFYNVLHNEFKDAKFKKYLLNKQDNGEYDLVTQSNDSPFSYHLFLKAEIEKAIETGQLRKYHFNYLRNILEKTSTFLGYENWGNLLPTTGDGKPNPYETRMINFSSHSKHAGEEVTELTEDDKRVLSYLVRQINEMYRFKSALSK